MANGLSLTAVVFVAALILAGCSTSAQRQVQQSNAGFQDPGKQLIACVETVRSKPEYDPIRRHAADPKTGQHSMTQLTDEAIPTRAEAHLVAAEYDETSACRSAFLNAFATSRPDLVPIFATFFTNSAALVAELVERKITWAAAARRGDQFLSDARQQLAAENGKFAQQQQQLNQQQQLINAMNRPAVVTPVQTNCNRIGTSVNCTSY